MKSSIATLALVAAFVLPPYAASSQQKSPTSEGKAARAAADSRADRTPRTPYSLYDRNPAWDVYVNGQYAGSDPDPRVRYLLRKEFCEDSVDGC